MVGRGHSLQLQLPNQKRSNSFSLLHWNIAFYCCSKIMRTRYLKILTVHTTSFGQFTAAFHIFKLHSENRSLHLGRSEKSRYLSLDLLKSFLLWTIPKNTSMNKSLNVRLQAESLTYRKSPPKLDKHPYKRSTIKYNSIKTETYENNLK